MQRNALNWPTSFHFAESNSPQFMVRYPGSSRVVLESAATRTVLLCPEEEGTVRGPRGATRGRFCLVASPISPLWHITPEQNKPPGMFRV